jgi:predicted NBD/HSP70 family sugar kinase
MPGSTVKVARGLLLYGHRVYKGDSRARTAFFRDVAVKSRAFSDAAEHIGGRATDPGLRFFESKRAKLAFGPGAGLVLGVSVGSESLRAALVDANGELWHHHECDAWPGQLSAPPEALLDRIREAAAKVLRPALENQDLLVGGALPFLGVAVAWPTAVDRGALPKGRALAHDLWRSGRTLTQRVSSHLNVEDPRSHALNDAHAAAIAVAFDHTRTREHVEQKHPHLTFVIRVAGGIGGATIIIEHPQPPADEFGQASGFPDSVLVGGFDKHAGEVGHIRVTDALVARLNRGRPPGLGKLAPFRCSCADPSGGEAPKHLEAYAAAPALAHRVAPDEPMSDVLTKVLSDPDDDVHRRALDDTGVLVGEALLGPMAMLNPTAIVLTGALAPYIAKTVDSHIANAAHPIHTHPTVRSLSREDNAYVRVKGAALAVIREHVHRELSSILSVTKTRLPAKVRELTVPLRGLPWEQPN